MELTINRWEGTFGGCRNVLYLDGVVIAWVYASFKTHQTVHLNWKHFMAYKGISVRLVFNGRKYFNKN